MRLDVFAVSDQRVTFRIDHVFAVVLQTGVQRCIGERSALWRLIRVGSELSGIVSLCPRSCKGRQRSERLWVVQVRLSVLGECPSLCNALVVSVRSIFLENWLRDVGCWGFANRRKCVGFVFHFFWFYDVCAGSYSLGKLCRCDWLVPIGCIVFVFLCELRKFRIFCLDAAFCEFWQRPSRFWSESGELYVQSGNIGRHAFGLISVGAFLPSSVISIVGSLWVAHRGPVDLRLCALGIVHCAPHLRSNWLQRCSLWWRAIRFYLQIERHGFLAAGLVTGR
mmetsp:Transcript_76796/g.205152  ORF Transcript_76796/g.205152 Transcript_76796/m.205152 type:complete len:280 (+) Transcript_76796:1772-2611(+)